MYGLDYYKAMDFDERTYTYSVIAKSERNKVDKRYLQLVNKQNPNNENI